jgi:hypothetical protein
VIRGQPNCKKCVRDRAPVDDRGSHERRTTPASSDGHHLRTPRDDASPHPSLNNQPPPSTAAPFMQFESFVVKPTRAISLCDFASLRETPARPPQPISLRALGELRGAPVTPARTEYRSAEYEYEYEFENRKSMWEMRKGLVSQISIDLWAIRPGANGMQLDCCYKSNPESRVRPLIGLSTSDFGTRLDRPNACLTGTSEPSDPVTPNVTPKWGNRCRNGRDLATGGVCESVDIETKKPRETRGISVFHQVEPKGVEPSTSALRTNGRRCGSAANYGAKRIGRRVVTPTVTPQR